LRLLAVLDRLYEGAVTDPGTWTEQAIVDAAAEAMNDLDAAPPKAVARPFRAGTRRARRLRGYWAEKGPSALPDWRSGVDEALGSRGWEPMLDLAMAGLDAEPSAELFEEVQARFRLVHFQPWLEGVTFDEWMSSQA
jgi:hypothetical protein